MTSDTLLADLNQGAGVTSGSFTVTDSDGVVGAINLTSEGITTVGGLVDAINELGADVTASINEAGDGITVIDNAGGDGPFIIVDTGTGTAASDLGIAGEGTEQTIGGSVVSALVGTQSGVISVEAEDTLEDIVAKINEDGRYGDASVVLNDDGSFSLQVRSNTAGESGQLAINTTGFEFDLRTDVRGQDALIAVSQDGGAERFVNSADGVFDLTASLSAAAGITSSTLLTEFASGTSTGSFTVTDSEGNISAVNVAVEEITTVGELVDSLNNLGLSISASINEEGTGINVIDTGDGSEALTIQDTGNGTVAQRLGIAGEASSETINGTEVNALIGLGADADAGDEASGLVLTVKELTGDPITITVDDDTSSVVESARTFVDQYNLLVERLDSLTFFDGEAEEVGLLFGSSEALRIRNSFTRLLSGRISGAGEFRSIGQVGIRFNDQGRLDLDESRLETALTENRLDVEAFFTTENTGLANRIDSLAESIAGSESGLLINRTTTLRSQIDGNNIRVDTLNVRLEAERERLLTQFFNTEEAIARLQSNQTAVAGIERLTIPS